MPFVIVILTIVAFIVIVLLALFTLLVLMSAGLEDEDFTEDLGDAVARKASHD